MARRNFQLLVSYWKLFLSMRRVSFTIHVIWLVHIFLLGHHSQSGLPNRDSGGKKQKSIMHGAYNTKPLSKTKPQQTTQRRSANKKLPISNLGQRWRWIWELLIYFINNKDMNYYKIQSIRALFISIGDAQKATILRNERHLGNPY